MDSQKGAREKSKGPSRPPPPSPKPKGQNAFSIVQGKDGPDVNLDLLQSDRNSDCFMSLGENIPKPPSPTKTGKDTIKSLPRTSFLEKLWKRTSSTSKSDEPENSSTFYVTTPTSPQGGNQGQTSPSTPLLNGSNNMVGFALLGPSKTASIERKMSSGEKASCINSVQSLDRNISFEKGPRPPVPQKPAKIEKHSDINDKNKQYETDEDKNSHSRSINGRSIDQKEDVKLEPKDVSPVPPARKKRSQRWPINDEDRDNSDGNGSDREKTHKVHTKEVKLSTCTASTHNNEAVKHEFAKITTDKYDFKGKAPNSTCHSGPESGMATGNAKYGLAKDGIAKQISPATIPPATDHQQMQKDPKKDFQMPLSNKPSGQNLVKFPETLEKAGSTDMTCKKVHATTNCPDTFDGAHQVSLTKSTEGKALEVHGTLDITCSKHVAFKPTPAASKSPDSSDDRAVIPDGKLADEQPAVHGGVQEVIKRLMRDKPPAVSSQISFTTEDRDVFQRKSTDNNIDDFGKPLEQHLNSPLNKPRLRKSQSLSHLDTSLKMSAAKFQNKSRPLNAPPPPPLSHTSPNEIPYDNNFQVPIRHDDKPYDNNFQVQSIMPDSSSSSSGSATFDDQQLQQSNSLNTDKDQVTQTKGHYYTEAELEAMETSSSPKDSPQVQRRSVDHVYEDIEFPNPPKKAVRSSSARMSSELRGLAERQESLRDERLAKLKQNLFDPTQLKVETKLGRKLTRKESKRVVRKLTQRIKENHLPKWRNYLGSTDCKEDEIVLEGDDIDLDDLLFTDSESEPEYEDDNASDSDSDFESELFERIITGQPPQEKSVDEAMYAGFPKHQRIAIELLTTEEKYVKKLELLDQTFHTRILLENRTQKMIPDEDIPKMFSNIKSIYQFHKDFLLPQLEKRMKEWNTTPKIGDVMKKFAPFLKLYSEYVSNFDNATEIIQSWREKSPKFASLLQEIESKPECGQLALLHHMLEPIQRVPRYQLLLKDYKKHLPEGSEDLQDTLEALKLVTDAATRSNEIMRENEKFRKLLDLNVRLGGTFNLISPTRELIKEGKVTKVAARSGALQERYIYLFNDLILLCQTLPVTLGLIEEQRVKAVLEMDGMTILDGDNLETPNTFYIKAKQKALELHCESMDEVIEWQTVLWNTIRNYMAKKHSRSDDSEWATLGTNKLGKVAPKWVKDQEASLCMKCGTEFTLLRNRRHHCRACGEVVCGRCSPHKMPLQYDSNRPNRVCNDCFKVLKKIASASITDISKPELQGEVHIRKKGVLNVKANDSALIAGYMFMSVDTKNWQKRYFAVHRDFVLYSFKAHQDIKAMTSLPLPGYSVQVCTSNDPIDRENVFKISHPQQKKIYYFQSDEKYKEWFYTLQFVVQADLPPQAK